MTTAEPIYAEPIYATELLDVAVDLAYTLGGSDALMSARLRRSLSTSYYALFHELTSSAAALLCGDGPDAEVNRNLAARWISHTDLLSLAKAVGDTSRAIGVMLEPPDPRLSKIVRIFRLLQDRRERADYDHEYEVSSSSAMTIAQEAAEAVRLSRELWDAQDASYLRFLRLMVGAVRIARNR